MNELKEIYERITFLRQKGVKMKDMAEKSGFSPSVLSAIYSTVLPAYFKETEKGCNEDEALDKALVWVNNVSKKKLLGSLPVLRNALFTMEIVPQSHKDTSPNPFLCALECNLKETANQIANYSGIYLSYSVSSSSPAMKIEPYLIAPSESGNYVEVGHQNVYGTTHWGAVMMNGLNHMYLVFNENRPPQLALFYIYLKIPMYDRPPYLRGIYTCCDYNYNPIARRILFVKMSESTDRAGFLKLKGILKSRESLNETEKRYYDYTCSPEDVIRMCNIPSPQMTDLDLEMEKKFLNPI